MIGPETMNTPPLIEDEISALIAMSPGGAVKVKTTIRKGKHAGDDMKEMTVRLRTDKDVENEEKEGHEGEHEKRPRRMAKTSTYLSNLLLHTMRKLVEPKTKTDRRQRGPHPKTKAKKKKLLNPPPTASYPN